LFASILTFTVALFNYLSVNKSPTRCLKIHLRWAEFRHGQMDAEIIDNYRKAWHLVQLWIFHKKRIWPVYLQKSKLLFYEHRCQLFHAWVWCFNKRGLWLVVRFSFFLVGSLGGTSWCQTLTEFTLNTQKFSLNRHEISWRKYCYVVHVVGTAKLNMSCSKNSRRMSINLCCVIFNCIQLLIGLKALLALLGF